MKTTKRFEQAVSKLYNAFHKGELCATDCEKCAVGNMVGNDLWSRHSVFICGTTKEDLKFLKREYPIKFYNEALNEIDLAEKECLRIGYSVNELAKVERLFMDMTSSAPSIKECEFNGLCAVVEYLCELEEIPNVMDYKSLFETNDKGEVVNELSF